MPFLPNSDQKTDYLSAEPPDMFLPKEETQQYDLFSFREKSTGFLKPTEVAAAANVSSRTGIGIDAQLSDVQQTKRDSAFIKMMDILEGANSGTSNYLLDDPINYGISRDDTGTLYDLERKLRSIKLSNPVLEERRKLAAEKLGVERLESETPRSEQAEKVSPVEFLRRKWSVEGGNNEVVKDLAMAQIFGNDDPEIEKVLTQIE